MRKVLLVSVLFALCITVTMAQSYDYYSGNSYKPAKGAYHNDLEFILHGGVLQSDLRYGNSTAFDLGIDYTPYESGDDMFSYSFITVFAKSRDYWSINPLGASAIVLTLFCKNVIDDNETAKTVLMIMAGESMSLNFALTEHIEVAPYWNLLRLSHWQGGSTYLTGSVGIRANFYFGPEDRWSVRARGDYSWGYGNPDFYKEWIYNIFGDSDEWTNYYEYHKPHTPFKGWNYGISIGYSYRDSVLYPSIHIR